MNDTLFIGLCILGIVIIVGVVLGLYLAHHATSVNDDEEYECDAQYGDVFNEKWKQNGPKDES